MFPTHYTLIPRSLTNGLNGQIFAPDEIDNTVLFDSNVIVDLSRVGSQETNSLLMGILVLRLSEHRMTHTISSNQNLRHVTVLEEAHNILKSSTHTTSEDGGDIAGKSVEMISNAIAEMRTYGEGFINADQYPNAVDISAIRNTNIIMRLPEESDRRISGKSAAMKDTQLDEIARLPKGVAVIYQNDWTEPILCKIDKFEDQEKEYCVPVSNDSNDIGKKAFSILISFVAKNRLDNPDSISDNQISWAIESAIQMSMDFISFKSDVDILCNSSTVLIPDLFKQLKARSDSSSSSIFLHFFIGSTGICPILISLSISGSLYYHFIFSSLYSIQI